MERYDARSLRRVTLGSSLDQARWAAEDQELIKNDQRAIKIETGVWRSPAGVDMLQK